MEGIADSHYICAKKAVRESSCTHSFFIKDYKLDFVAKLSGIVI
ncbi:hypothetical protein [Candidatus Cyrtobacter comes]|nr:hypothetical protein [Candidatus Cyrtobacter comes]